MPSIRAIHIVHEGWARFFIATIAAPGGESYKREIEDHGNAVAVLPYDPVRRMAMLVRVVRAPVLYAGAGPALLEAPAGMIEDESPEDTVRREAIEEVGLELGTLEPIANAWSSPGVSTERIGLYLAAYGEAARTGAGGGLASENEDLAVIEMPLADLWARFENGDLSDLKTIALLQALRLRRPELFG